jgi:hypothetical protein
MKDWRETGRILVEMRSRIAAEVHKRLYEKSEDDSNELQFTRALLKEAGGDPSFLIGYLRSENPLS